ncbi:sulfatase-like hydrolase/transferase, partial [Nocardioides massiliensis]
MEPVGEIDRRSLMLAGAATAGGLVLESLTPAAAAPVPRRPNIVWFRSEDNGVDFVGCYGNPLARTPTIDKLAREGVRFDLHFATSPVCAPTKLATLTGMHAESLGPGHHMRADARTPPFVRGFATYLRRAGYWCSEQGLPGANPDRNTTSTRTGYHDASGDWRNRPAGKPFFVLRGSQTTHETQAAFPYPGRTNPAKVRLPVYHPDDPVLRLGRAHYFDRVAAMDGELAGLLRRLEDDNLLANTIVIYSADHGGVLPRSKRYCYDSGLRAPLVMWFPPRWRHLAPVAPGSVYRAPTSSVDAPAAILSLAGVRRPAHFQGKPFAGTTVSRRAYAFSGRGRMDEQLDMVRTVRGRRYRYIRNYRPHLTYAQHHQFMWLQHPDEVVNLAGRPEHRATLRRMRR